MLDESREQLTRLHQDAERFTGPFSLERARVEDVEFVRRIVLRDVRAARLSSTAAPSATKGPST